MSETAQQGQAELLLNEAREQLGAGLVAEAAVTLGRVIAELEDQVRDDDRPGAAPLLTPGELRVARMAVTGMKNREIAGSLAVSVKAVEYHLANTYRKLGVRSRMELAQRFTWAAWMLGSVVAGAGA